MTKDVDAMLNDYWRWFAAEWNALASEYPAHRATVAEVLRIAEEGLVGRRPPTRRQDQGRHSPGPEGFTEGMIDKARILAADFGVFCRVASALRPDLREALQRTGGRIGATVFAEFTLPSGVADRVHSDLERETWTARLYPAEYLAVQSRLGRDT